VIEITCPNCGARYQVPAEALGADGREVTCSSCGHIWVARPPRAEARMPEPEPAAGDGPSRDRRRQMANIRQMLDEVQTAERRRAETAPPPHSARRWGAEDEAPRRGGRRAGFGVDAVVEDDEAEQFLRGRVGGAGGQSGRMKALRERGRDSDSDRRRLMDRHSRRERRQKDIQRRGSGSGYTGFTLVVLVSLVFVGLYALEPQISARMPEAQPALANYVAAVEVLRGQMAEGYSAVAGMISEQIAAVQGES